MKMTDAAPVTTEFTQEIRFAVVMYGGSSLAVYMNGVAQELLHLVRATAPAVSDPSRLHVPDSELGGSERVFRQLGQMLSRGKPAGIVDPQTADVRTRFVIDVLAGTSAGGINGVFLAKALVNDQSMASLRDLWMKTADFDKLLNDNQSGSDPKAQDPPHSIVNSPLMYAELLRALGKMDQSGIANRSPYTDQLDLFTTLTDIQGQVVSLKLADVVATELRHRQSLHFSYSTEEATGKKTNDFLPEFNEFIAFAAQCTSAHPAAFEPMALEDIRNAGANPDNKKWQTFFEDYLQPVQESAELPHGRQAREDLASPPKLRDELVRDFLTRPFSDGGVLDNSPFSFAISQLPFRNVSLPVERKLLYVEPAPDHPELVKQTNKKPNAITNALLSVSSLPSYQFIRDDIRRVLDRNRLVERVEHILSGLEEDIETQGSSLPVVSSDHFRTMDVREMIERMGSGWGGYQRLRVAETTDDLVEIINRAVGFNDESREWLAIRYVVGWWRYLNYFPYKELNNPRKTENEFLYAFDLRRQIRRLKLLLKKIGEITCFDEQSRQILTRHSAGARIDELSGASERGSNLRKQFRDEFSVLTRGINNVLRDLCARRDLLTARVDPDEPENHPMAKPLSELHITGLQLTHILDQGTEKKRDAAAAKLFGEKGVLLQPVVDALIEQLSIIPNSSARIRSDVLKLQEGLQGTPQYVARETILYYYNHFDQFDMISYPIVYSTDVGEEIDKIAVFRVSPEDVSALIENKLDRGRKLAGLSLGHFGALLEERFRFNDILWGRLDGAERLITALLESAPPPDNATDIEALRDKKTELIRQAQLAILVEELDKCDDAMKRSILGDCGPTTNINDSDRQRMLDDLNRAPIPPATRDFFQGYLEDGDPLRKFVRNYDFEHKPNPQKLIETAGRASRILGKMVDQIADDYRVRSPQLAWVTRLLKIFWGLVEVSLPDTALHILTRHFLKLVYLFEVLMIAGGILLLNSTIQQFGTAALAVTLAIDALIYILTDLMKGRHVVLKVVGAFVASVLILSTVLGIALLATLLGANALSPFIRWLLTHGVGK